MEKEESNILKGISKTIHDTLEKTGKLPTFGDHKDLGNLIEIRRELIKYLFKLTHNSDKDMIYYEEPHRQIHIYK